MEVNCLVKDETESCKMGFCGVLKLRLFLRDGGEVMEVKFTCGIKVAIISFLQRSVTKKAKGM